MDVERIGRPGRIGGPRDYALQDTPVDTKPCLSEALGQAFHLHLVNQFRRGKAVCHMKGNRTFPEIIKDGCIARQDGVQMLADLAAERRTLFNQIPPVASQQS